MKIDMDRQRISPPHCPLFFTIVTASSTIADSLVSTMMKEETKQVPSAEQPRRQLYLRIAFVVSWLAAVLVVGLSKKGTNLGEPQQLLRASNDATAVSTLSIEDQIDTMLSPKKVLGNVTLHSKHTYPSVDQYTDDFEGPYTVPYTYMLHYDRNFKSSPFWRRWRMEWELPAWAEKKSRNGQRYIAAGSHTCFVHVGKTAGSTIGCALGFSLHCEEDAAVPSGFLPLYSTNVLHKDVNDCPDYMPNYLFVARDPLERVKSAYLYGRQDVDYALNSGDPDCIAEMQQERIWKLHKDCPFWTLNELAENGLAEDGTASEKCKERAYNAIRGYQRQGEKDHMYYNYRFYLEESRAFALHTNIWVIRTEHTTDDWNSIERLLTGQMKTYVDEFPRSNDSADHHVNEEEKILSSKAQTLLCHALCEEIQLYKALLYRASNLVPGDFLVSMRELYNKCPIEAQATSCS